MMDDCGKVAEQNWKKLSNAAKNVGYAEGADKGRESVFQISFDTGYKLGFAIGISAGLNAGLLCALATQNKTDITPKLKEILINSNVKLILDNASKGQCICCINEQFLEGSIDSVVSIQSEKNDLVESRIRKEIVFADLGIDINL